ncbi:Leucine--tRNA ligase [Trichinella pseudospiralis]
MNAQNTKTPQSSLANIPLKRVGMTNKGTIKETTKRHSGRSYKNLSQRRDPEKSNLNFYSSLSVVSHCPGMVVILGNGSVSTAAGRKYGNTPGISSAVILSVTVNISNELQALNSKNP